MRVRGRARAVIVAEDPVTFRRPLHVVLVPLVSQRRNGAPRQIEDRRACRRVLTLIVREKLPTVGWPLPEPGLPPVALN